MGISDRIEAFICELTKADDGWVELGRNELAGIFNCVPSQINYVISTRFTPEKGYAVESRRGGGGFIKIRRVSQNAGEVIAGISDEMSAEEVKNVVGMCVTGSVIDQRSARLIMTAACDREIETGKNAGRIRASLLKNMLAEAVKF